MIQNIYMEEAIVEAKKAAKKGEVPVGAVIVYEDKIIARGHNQIEKKKSAIHHAEMIAIEKASKKRKDWRLNDCVMYVTLKPCTMCMGAIYQSRIDRVVYGAEKQGEDQENGFANGVLEKNVAYENECSYLLKEFFKERRNIDK